MKPAERARLVAAQVLDRVLRGGAYSNVIIRTATEHLEPRDRRFVQRLVFGAVRRLLRIDRALAAVATRPLERIDPLVLSSLRIGAEELLFLGAPPYAAVDGAVAAVRVGVGEHPTAFVNGVLRALAIAGEPEPGGEIAALTAGVPGWMYHRVADQLGPDEADAFFSASNAEPPVGLRLRTPLALGEPVAGIDGAVTLPAMEGAADHIASGTVVVADPASTAVGLAVAAEPGMAVADLAAAPGGKTWHVWDQLEGEGLLIAADRHPRRLASARRRLPAGIQWLVADAAAPPLRSAAFDRVLLDAPCTGLGTLRRRPEIRHRIRPASPAELGARQRRMLEAALALVKKGGRLVYSVCTLFREETVDVVSGLKAAAPAGLPGETIDGGLLLAPHLTGTDGMFISVLHP